VIWAAQRLPFGARLIGATPVVVAAPDWSERASARLMARLWQFVSQKPASL
jgi:hypothetical protein